MMNISQQIMHIKLTSSRTILVENGSTLTNCVTFKTPPLSCLPPTSTTTVVGDVVPCVLTAT